VSVYGSAISAVAFGLDTRPAMDSVAKASAESEVSLGSLDGNVPKQN